MRQRNGLVLAAVLVLATACTSTTPTSTARPPTSSVVAPSPTETATPSEAPTGPLVFGAPLPAGCPGGSAAPAQTIAFVASGRAWALSPNGRLTCLFETEDPMPFAWGPQGDRVLLGGMQVRLLDGSTFEIDDRETDLFDWGRPIGKSIVFREDVDLATRKFVLADDEVVDLPDLPSGVYEDIAYHPSGLALAVSVKEKDGTPGIYVSTNEGERPERIVVGVSATSFPSVDFTSDGRFLLYLAHHKGDYSQLHLIDLLHPDTLEDLWKSPAGVRAGDLLLPPDLGDTLAFTTGRSCEELQAMWGSVNEVTPALPDEPRPTLAIGYLDVDRLLVGAATCGDRMDLYVVTESGADLVATEVVTAAPRSDGPDHAVPLPEDLVGEIREFG